MGEPRLAPAPSTAGAALTAALLFLGCGAPASTTPDAGHAPDAAPIAVRLPHDDGPFFPSQTRLAEGEAHADIALLADVATCTQCHADAAAQHAASAHARSSFDNPWYRAVIDQLREDAGFTASRHCAGCHDPLLLLGGRMDAPIDPADPVVEPLARAGVTCMVCHGIVETRADGNGSYTLSTAPVPLPDPNDDEAVAAHRARVAPSVLRTPGLCGSCHRGFLGTHTGGEHFLPGIDEIGPWRGSAWGDQHAQRLDDVEVAPGACRGCHMPDEHVRAIELGAPDGLLASHRFAGGHSPIAAQSGDPAQLEAVRARQQSAATIDVAALVRADGTRALPPDGAAIDPADAITFDVVVRNTGTGHRFPGGARDLRDHWIEVRVVDASGRALGGAGTEHEREDDASAFVLGVAVADADGAPDRRHLVHRFRALAWDHTIAPRDALAVRYALDVPRDATLPLRIEAVLRARRHHAGVRAFACEASRSERGRLWGEGVRRAGGAVLDGCADEPVIDLARAEVTVGGAAPAAVRPSWERLHDHALAISHDLQERLDDVRPSVAAALGALDAAGPPDADRVRARLLLVLADVEARQGRREQALALCDRVESLVGASPAIDRVRGRAWARVWRWEEAASAYGRVAAAAPLDTDAHRDHASALGSLGDRPRDALAAAVRGMALQPRDESLLRTQTLALESLHDVRVTAARSAFLRYRRPDDETDLRLACDRTVPGCAQSRLPIPTIPLTGDRIAPVTTRDH